jgi:hypothetical protein
MADVFREELESIREEFVELIGALEELLDGATLEESVSVGQVLYILFDQIKARVQSIKEMLREEVAENHPGKVKIAGVELDHQASVVIPKPRMVLRKEADPETLREPLGEDFETLFRPRTTYTLNQKALERVFAKVDLHTKRRLLDLLEQTQGVGRVSFLK